MSYSDVDANDVTCAWCCRTHQRSRRCSSSDRRHASLRMTMTSLRAGRTRPWGPCVWNPSRPHRAWIIRRMSSRSLAANSPTIRRLARQACANWQSRARRGEITRRALRGADLIRQLHTDEMQVAVPSDHAYGWVFHRCANPNANAKNGSRKPSTGPSGLAAAMKGRWTVSQTAALAPFEVQRPPEPLASGQMGFRRWIRVAAHSERPTGMRPFLCSLVCRTKGTGAVRMQMSTSDEIQAAGSTRGRDS